jgi:hypothetical protein
MTPAKPAQNSAIPRIVLVKYASAGVRATGLPMRLKPRTKSCAVTGRGGVVSQNTPGRRCTT